MIINTQCPGADPWETEYTKEKGAFFYKNGLSSYISVPRKEDDLPAEAFALLSVACDAPQLGDYLVIPASVRRTAGMDEKKISPMQVIAFGSYAIGLWAQTPEPGLKALIRNDELLSITDIKILLYGELVFRSNGGKLTIRYNLIDWRKVERHVLELRKDACRERFPFNDPACDQSALAYKWQYALKTRYMDIYGGNQNAVICQERKMTRKEQNQIVVINAYEIILLNDAEYPFNRYGSEITIINRASIEAMSIEQDRLIIENKGVRTAFEVKEELAPILCEST